MQQDNERMGTGYASWNKTPCATAGCWSSDREIKKNCKYCTNHKWVRKRVNEFKLLGESRRRVVTNLANEMRLRLHFLGTPFNHFKVKKAWPEIRLLRDILLCCKKMLRVFIEEKLHLQYFSLPPKQFAVVSVTETLLNELGYTAFQIHYRCDEMDIQNLCLLYRDYTTLLHSQMKLFSEISSKCNTDKPFF